MIAKAFTGAGTCLETAFGRFWCHYFPEVQSSKQITKGESVSEVG